jgi:uncharacterized protein YuzE
MKMTYDREADALACDLDEKGRVVGIEILGASSLFHRPGPRRYN